MPCKRAFSRAAARAFEQPLSELNITPLINVLLVMMILTLAMAMVLHKVAVDLSQGSAPPGETVTHPLALERDGGVTLDGVGGERCGDVGAVPGAEGRPCRAAVMRADPEARYDRFTRLWPKLSVQGSRG